MLLVLVFVLLLFIRSPWGQDIIVQKATSYVSERTSTKVSIDRLFVTFSGNLYLEGLFLEDLKGDTLIYSKNLETGVALKPLISSGDIKVSTLQWEGLRANVNRDSIYGTFNFDFLINAFSEEEEDQVPPGENEVVKNGEKQSSGLPKLTVGPVDLNDFIIKYYDGELGVDLYASWDKIRVRLNEIDLDKMNFGIEEFAITGSKIDYKQFKPFPESEDTTASDLPLPLLVLEDLKIKDVKWNYLSIPDGLEADLDIGDFWVQLPEADLESQRIMLKSIGLHDSDIKVKIHVGNESAERPGQNQENSESFDWPDWVVELGNLDFENNTISYQSGETKKTQGEFNPDFIQINNLTLLAHGIFLKDKIAGLNLDEFSFSDHSGFELKTFSFDFKVSDEKSNITNLTIETNASSLKANIALDYASMAQLIENPDKSSFRLDLKSFQTDASDALFFAPELGNELYFEEIRKNGLKANGRIQGNMQALTVPEFRMEYGEHTELTISQLDLRNFTETEKLYFELGNLAFESNEQSLYPLLKEFDLDYNIPESLQLEAQAKGSLQELFANVALQSSDGNVLFQADFTDRAQFYLKSSLELQGFDLGKILNIPELEPISLKTIAEGEGTDLYDLEGFLDTEVEHLQWVDYDLSSLVFQITAKDTVADLILAIDKDILDVRLEAKAKLDTIQPKVYFTLDVRNLETQALSLTAQDISTRMKLFGEIEGPLDNIIAKLQLEDAFMYFERQTYPIGNMKIEALLSDTLTAMSVDSDFLKGKAETNGSTEALNAAIQNYFTELVSGKSDTVLERSIKAKAAFQFSPTPFIDQLLIAGIEELDTVSISFDFDAELAVLNAQVYLPYLAYTDASVRSFELDLDGDVDRLSLSAGFNELNIGPVDMGKTSVTGTFQEEDIKIDLLSLYNEEPIIDLKSVLKLNGDTLMYHIDPEGLIFNSRSWQISESNAIYYAENYLRFEDFSFIRNNQEFNLTNEVVGVEEEHLGIVLKEFNLSTFTSFLNPDEPILKGSASGELVVINPWNAIGILGNLRVNGLELLEIPLGTLQLDAEARTLEEYDFNLSLKEGMIDLDLIGIIEANEEGSLLDLELDINQFQVAMIEKFAEGELKDIEGFISGKVNVSGSIQEPVYEGELQFNEVSLLVSQLNNKFSVNEDKLRIDNLGLYFEDFDIQDESGQDFNIDGKIDTENFSQIGLDLKIRSENFQVLNSTREDNDLFYGRANINLDMDVKGNTDLPEIDLRLRINSPTNFTFIVPESQLDLVEKTGVVIFVNHEDPYDLLNKRETEISARGIQGYDVKANLQIDPEAVFNVIVDERTGDNLRLQGEADLNMLMNPNGDISLSGRYEVKSGHYELNLYNIVNRRFELAEGSTVSWSGNPLDASLNLRAIYNIRTSSSELMQAQLGGGATGGQGQFRQSLRFQVFLNIDGELVQPEISFDLGMQEQDRGAAGGAVYSMIQQINENEDEVTKQVFSLLVLNQFFPTMGDDGSGGGNVSVARSSVSQVLSTQLNALSDRLFGESGFSLDMDLDTYSDFQNGGPQDRTQLNVAARQRLLDDRLVISVGGQMDVEGGERERRGQSDALFGDVSVEYLLDERGQWRARAYRRNTFESVIDGQLIVTGLSLIFNKEFNEFKELWRGRQIDEAVKEEDVEEIDETED